MQSTTPGSPETPSSSIGQAANRRNAVSKEALSRLLTLDLDELRQQWRALYKSAPNLSRELLVRAVAHRMQELALGGLRPEPRRQLLRIAQQFEQTREATTSTRPELKPGTWLTREGGEEPVKCSYLITTFPDRAVHAGVNGYW